MAKNAPYSLLYNSRFYILLFAFLLSVIILSLTRLSIAIDQLFYIRLQQQYGLISIIFWYFALIISPIGYIIGKHRMKYIEYARRAIGVSAAYFALLHVAVALWGQLGGLGQIGFLPATFIWSIIYGTIALFVLLLMAATSFDRVIAYMTFRRWKWLHRLVYGAGVLVIIHIWSVGSHVTYSAVQIAALSALIILAGLESFRIITIMRKTHNELQMKRHFTAVFLILWSMLSFAIINLPSYVQNYNDHESDSHGTSHSQGNEH